MRLIEETDRRATSGNWKQVPCATFPQDPPDGLGSSGLLLERRAALEEGKDWQGTESQGALY